MLSSVALDAFTNALARAQGEFPAIEKKRNARIQTKTGGVYTYKYADIADVLSAIVPALSRNGLSLTQSTEVRGEALYIQTRIQHMSGQWISSDYPVCSLSGDHKAMGAALTYARRYALCALLGLAAEDELEGEGEDTSHQRDPDEMLREMQAEKKAVPKEPAPSKDAIDWGRKLYSAGALDFIQHQRDSTEFRAFWSRANKADREYVTRQVDEATARLTANPPQPPPFA